ncbi:hypothetical protein PPERSA_04024 [Pseudocohnilembus persalinus]|uniref:VWFA domain-containing protein n=1 Tax=Pseudocohnilembus persalinus TaxID=266149 RepID=A0A0V0QLI1_PSEPJ|nr:hypothetical protein PPERSA_04024 [Pseudocohnilembus persalinus]|eukprot:KRX02821.1 hypothetical protein PPERSA_04024 [Pseudocohnilembus persalinus]
MEQNKQQLNYFKIPQLANKNNQEQSHLIALLDSSYSMSGYWKHLSLMWNTYISEVPNKTLLTFSDSAHFYGDQKQMTSSIAHYNAGGTNIAKGFDLLNNTFQHINEKNITVMFVSDGQDSYHSNNIAKIIELVKKSLPVKQKKINFITVGVGSGFPTFLAMELRSIYHNGEENIPSVYLIDKCNDENCWHENFSMIQQHMDHKSEIKLIQQIQSFPWSDKKNETFENIWVLSESEQLKFQNLDITLEKVEIPSADQMTEILKQWLNNLQLLSLKQVNCQQAATQCLSLVNNWQEQQLNMKKQAQSSQKKLTFHQRMLKKQQNKDQTGLNILIKELKNIKQGNILNNLTEAEAAKRLAIGTQIGKYHSKALELKGLSVEEYLQAKNQFITIFNEIKDKISPESDQESSIISLQNQKEVFLESDLLQGLAICESQYDLVENLPLIGHGVYIKRFDGSMIDPYQITVSSVARHHKVVDSTALLGNQNNELVLKTGNNEEETINAVIPLFGEKDADLKQILTSKLYQILMTFNVMQNADTFFPNAYQALLANTCLYMILQNKSQWQQDILNQINSTLKITYADFKGFKKYQQALLQETNLAVVSEHPDCPYKCEDISKVVMVLNYIVKTDQIEDKKKIKEILLQVFQEFIGRATPNDAVLKDLFQILNKNDFKNKDLSQIEISITEKISQNLNQFYIESDLIKAIKAEIQNYDIQKLFDKQIQIELNKNNLKFLNIGKSSLENLKLIQQFFLPEEQTDLLNEENLIIWLNHATNFHSSMERNQNNPNIDVQNIKQKVIEQLTKDQINSKIEKIQENLINNLVEKYQDKQAEIHLYCKTFTQQELESTLKELNIQNEDQILINEINRLPIQACSAPKCQFYLKKDKQFPSHLQSTLPIPAFNKACLLTKQTDLQEIYNEIINGQHFDKNIGPFNLPKNNQFIQPEYKDQMVQIIQQTLKDLHKI